MFYFVFTFTKNVRLEFLGYCFLSQAYVIFVTDLVMSLLVVPVGIIASLTHWMLELLEMVEEEGKQINLLFHP